MQMKSDEAHTLRFLPFPLQYTTATSVLTKVAAIAGAMIPAGFTLPYCCLYAIILTGINCKEEIFNTKNVHISLLATRSPVLSTNAGACVSFASCHLSAHTPASPAPPPASPTPPSL